jgi:hypothetical protein
MSALDAAVQTARAEDTSKSTFDILPAEGISAAVEIAGLRHVPLAVPSQTYTHFWRARRGCDDRTWPIAAMAVARVGGRLLG